MPLSPLNDEEPNNLRPRKRALLFARGQDRPCGLSGRDSKGRACKPGRGRGAERKRGEVTESVRLRQSKTC
jgi:hypothetical protein